MKMQKAQIRCDSPPPSPLQKVQNHKKWSGKEPNLCSTRFHCSTFAPAQQRQRWCWHQYWRLASGLGRWRRCHGQCCWSLLTLLILSLASPKFCFCVLETQGASCLFHCFFLPVLKTLSLSLLYIMSTGHKATEIGEYCQTTEILDRKWGKHCRAHLFFFTACQNSKARILDGGYGGQKHRKNPASAVRMPRGASASVHDR